MPLVLVKSPAATWNLTVVAPNLAVTENALCLSCDPRRSDRCVLRYE